MCYIDLSQLGTSYARLYADPERKVRRIKSSPSELKSPTKRARYGRIGNGRGARNEKSRSPGLPRSSGRSRSPGFVGGLSGQAVHPHVEEITTQIDSRLVMSPPCLASQPVLPACLASPSFQPTRACLGGLSVRLCQSVISHPSSSCLRP